MGNNNSSNKKVDYRVDNLSSNNHDATYTVHPDSLEGKALINYNQRINSYKYHMHGPYYEYVEWCQAKHEYECLPLICRQGSRY